MKKYLCLFLVLLLSVVFSACSSRSGDPSSEDVRATAAAITISGHSGLTEITGSYGAGCVSRSGAWSARITPGALSHPQLTVRKNNTACVLTLSDVTDDTGHTYSPSSPPLPMLLSDSYTGNEHAFNDITPPGVIVNFQGNAKLDDLLFDNDFTITFLYSSAANDTNSDVNAGVSIVTGTAVAQAVPAPAYSIDVSGLVLNEDASNNVDSLTGSAKLTLGVQAAETYAIISPVASLNTWDAINTAYATAAGYLNDLSLLTVGGVVTIDASLLNMGTGVGLPATRVLILAHVENGVYSYETFTLTFHP